MCVRARGDSKVSRPGSRFNSQAFIDELKGHYPSQKPTAEERAEEQRLRQEAAWDSFYNTAYKAARIALETRVTQLTPAECHALAVDAVSQAYLKIHRFTSPTKTGIVGWVVRLAYNLAITYLRKEASLRRTHSTFAESAQSTGPGATQIPAASSFDPDHYGCRECAKKSRDQLSGPSKKIIRQTYEEGMSVGEIKKSTGEPEGTIKSRRSRAKKEFEAKYRKEREAHVKRLAKPPVLPVGRP